MPPSAEPVAMVLASRQSFISSDCHQHHLSICSLIRIGPAKTLCQTVAATPYSTRPTLPHVNQKWPALNDTCFKLVVCNLTWLHQKPTQPPPQFFLQHWAGSRPSDFGFYLPRGNSFGYFLDGLLDPYNQLHMGSCAEETAMPKNFAIESYQRAAKAWEAGAFKDKIIPVEINVKLLDKVTIVSKDEDHINIKFDKVRTLKPVFKNERGTVTAANTFTLNDGASAVVLITAEESRLRGIKKLAKIISYAEAACAPINFPIAPTLGIPMALDKAGLEFKDMTKIKINDAFPVAALASMKILEIKAEKVNVNGGAVALGNPIGSSCC
ncbi:hypothetical protein PTTG_00075 [Puccinia triticina 1-1 BBBD Race 1]|uniref:Thiolase N-terminal domain-containing protein n=1 Tax=Puccinia triticina (isolate 1-1 / race 1 (BBBD)) TaxID=630390 RepID=A0A180G2K4_PUCT1|nr:hypothetical protein PTTG_00075 [Puccinia triticina 1-1 BBBD Race 1]